MAVKPIPDGYHSVQPYLMVKGAKALLEFLKTTFDAKETENMSGPDGTVMHAEVKIGDSTVMMSDAQGPWQPTTAALYVYVTDVDATFRRAIAAGATSAMEPADQFYGDRHGGVKDQFGNFWWIATRIEDVSKEEMSKRAQEYMEKRKSS
jgi:PhnB protein